MYKIPFRLVYCDTLGSWIKEMIWVFVIIKVFKSDIDAMRMPKEFYEQLGLSAPEIG